ncbi:response regulator [Nocardioides jensenii]|uniref:response regulator n=1 Tax=Nocardioides jensenii TaxID=1843 RepID=UPI000836BC54|nr:response regulator transcription factor [Nocardioides jensenii]
MSRVVIADDQDLIRAGLRAIIEAEPDLLVVGEAANGREAARAAVEHRADVVLMDVQMPDHDGLAGVTAVRRARPEAAVVMLTMYDLDDYVLGALRAGARGFLLKTTPPGELTAAIRDAAAGRHVFAASVTSRLVTAYVGRTPPADRGRGAIDTLTQREGEVYRAMARGLSNAEIGADLHLSEATVKTYVTRVFAKLGVRDRVQAVILAFESGFVG